MNFLARQFRRVLLAPSRYQPLHTKNLLLFAGLVFAKRYRDRPGWVHALLAAVGFGLTVLIGPLSTGLLAAFVALPLAYSLP